MNTYIVLGVVAAGILLWKGYIRLPGQIGGGNTSGKLGVKFIQSIQDEAQAEAAENIAKKIKEDVKAKLQGPFGIEPEEPAK